MTILLRDALATEVFRDAIVIAGDTGMDNEVQYVTVMDVMNIHKWLKSDGALLLTGHNLSSWLDEAMLKQLQMRKVAAIGTKRRCISGFSDEMLHKAEQAHIPIIIIAEEFSWMEIIQPITEMLLSAQYALNEELMSMHNILMNGLLHGDDLDTLCRDAANIIRHPLAVLDNYFNPMGSSFTADPKDFAAKLSRIWVKLEQELSRPYQPHTPLTDEDGSRYFLMPLISRGEHCGYILIGAGAHELELTETEQIKIEQLAMIAAYELLKRNEQQLSVRNYYNMFWNRFLNDQVDLDEIRSFVSSIKKNIALKNYLAVVEMQQEAGRMLFSHNQRFNHLMEALQAELPNFKQTVLFESGPHLVMLIPETTTDIVAYVRDLDRILSDMFKNLRYRIGVSALHGLEEGSIAYQEASCALNVIRSGGHEAHSYCFYDDLGVLKLFVQHGAIDRRAFDDFINTHLGPLLEYDKQRDTQLVTTFATYLHNNMSPSKTAAALFIHKNTLLARLKRVESILHIDLDDYYDVFNVSTAMMIYRVYNTISNR